MNVTEATQTQTVYYRVFAVLLYMAFYTLYIFNIPGLSLLSIKHFSKISV